MKRLAGVVIAAIVAAAPVAASPVLDAAPAQGAVVRGQVPVGTRLLTLDGKPVKFGADRRFVIGFGRDAGPKAALAWTAGDATITLELDVAPRQWRIQSLPTLPPRPVPDAEFEARRPGEVAKIVAAREGVSDGTGWTAQFTAPAEGPVTGVYGSQRILAGTPSSPHAGIDFSARTGAPVTAPAPGVVRMAEGPFTLEGNIVMIDHGFGLVSALLHLSRIDVKPGDVVMQGQRIGSVGATGRATGPHVHWGVTWTDVRVDPAGLLRPHKGK